MKTKSGKKRKVEIWAVVDDKYGCLYYASTKELAEKWMKCFGFEGGYGGGVYPCDVADKPLKKDAPYWADKEEKKEWVKL